MDPGQNGVQCNMTNTMNTPIEALEIAYPLRVERYQLREGSAGKGRRRGGSGLVRALRVIGHEARISMQSDRRRFAPFGLHGDPGGATGQNLVISREGVIREQPGKASFSLEDGDMVVVETPGGGGPGTPAD